jgi:glycosyltransferase involved in cell wall biosynthesis
VLVSVVITTHNRSTLLKRALESVLKQTYTNLEVIIVDDASTDDTAEIIKRYQLKDERIQYIRNGQNSGANYSRNKGLMAASGEFIAGLDDDDEFLDNRIELLLMNHDDKYAFVSSWNIVIRNNETKSFRQPLEEYAFNELLVHNYIMNQALVKKERLISIKGYDENLLACQDYDVWLRLLQKYGPAKIVQEYTQVIYEDNSLRRISNPGIKKFRGYFMFYKKYKQYMNIGQQKYWLFRLYGIRRKKISTKVARILEDKITLESLSNYRY